MSDDITPLTKEDGQSKDLIKENLEKLKQLFPEIVTDGKVDFETLKEELGEFRETSDERYSFTWNGKSQARKLAMEPSRGTLRPAPEESVSWDDTKHLFIEGDNLEVLKLLQRSYHKKVKMIYIDPPYNTGNDFVYSDDYQDNLSNYLKLTGQLDGEGNKISSNPEYSGRYHTDWLNMMYPRLKLSRELLRSDGVIFISIDDHEVANLRLICNEVFGEENFITQLVWERAYAPINLKKHFSPNHDHILVYAKDINETNEFLESRTEEANARYSNPDNDPRGPYKADNLSVGPPIEDNIYEIETPSGRKVTPPAGYSWRYSKERFKELVEDNRIWFGKDGNNVPAVKRFISEVKDGITPMTVLRYKDVGHTQDARKETKELFDDQAVFDYPKPVSLISKLIDIVTSDRNGIVLDFFSGSATTAHSVLEMNSTDGGTRQHIQVQLPEPIDKKSEAYKAGYSNLAEIAKDRLRRVKNKISNDKPNYDGDLGFKVFKLDSSNIKPWDPNFEGGQTSLDDVIKNSIENVKPDRSELDLLYEVLLKYGIDLSLPIEDRTIDGSKVYIGGAGALVLCPSDNITLEVVEGIAEIKEEFNPEIMRVVFRDNGFKDDVVKTNAIQILKQHGIEDVKSI